MVRCDRLNGWGTTGGMMQRRAKRLVLNKVTLRLLSSKDLKSVAGGLGCDELSTNGETVPCQFHEELATGFEGGGFP